MKPRILIVGFSTRALAEAMYRDGYDVAAIDAFGDLDLRAAANPVIRCHPFSTRRAAPLARQVPSDIVLYTSPFENDPGAVTRLARSRELWGNTPETLQRVRDPVLLSETLTNLGFATPEVRTTAPRRGTRDASRPWLLKPRHSGGGHGITPWRPGTPVPRTHVLQEYIRGRAGSIAFTVSADGLTVLAFTRQLTGDPRFGASGFRYTGSITDRPPQWVAARAIQLATAIAASFDMRGLNGVDYIVRDGIPYPIEVNPRYTAPMELIDRAAHDHAIQGKAIVFARRTLRVGDTTSWLDDLTVRDIPMPHSLIPSGHPICTVFASGSTTRLCDQRLAARAARVYALVGRRG